MATQLPKHKESAFFFFFNIYKTASGFNFMTLVSHEKQQEFQNRVKWKDFLLSVE